MATNELRADLRITGENAMKRGLKDVGDAADKAGDQLEGMAKDADRLAKQAAEAKAEVKNLAHALAEAGDLADVDLVKAFKKGKRNQKFLEGLAKELQEEIEEAAAQAADAAGDIGGEVGQELAESIGKGLVGGKQHLIAGVAVLAVSMLPFLGAATASAVLGGVGIGGIVGGFALAAQDQRVKDAATTLGQTALKEFVSAADSFIAPAVESLHLLERAAVDVAGGIGQGFRIIAPVLLPLTQGIVGLVDEMLPGLIKGFEASKPVIRAIANELPEIGAALGDFIEVIGSESDGAVLGFQALSEILQLALRHTGGVIAALSKTYEWSIRTGAAVSGALEDIFAWIPGLGTALGALSGMGNDQLESMLKGLNAAGDSSGDFAGNLRSVRSAAADSAAALEDMKNAIDDLFDTTMNLDQATLAYKQSIVDTRKELTEGTRTLDLNTQAGRDNREIALGRIEVIERLRDSEAASTLGLEEANKRYLERIELLRQDLLSMGYNAKAVDELTKKYLAIPNAINVQLNLTTGGSAAAWSAFRALERQSMDAKVHIGGGGFEERALGGPTRAGRTYLVGENGPELWSENANGYVTPAAQTAGMMSGASGGGSRPMVSVTFAPSGNSAMDQIISALWPYILKQVRIDGGDLTAFGAA